MLNTFLPLAIAYRHELITYLTTVTVCQTVNQWECWACVMSFLYYDELNRKLDCNLCETKCEYENEIYNSCMNPVVHSFLPNLSYIFRSGSDFLSLFLSLSLFS